MKSSVGGQDPGKIRGGGRKICLPLPYTVSTQQNIEVNFRPTQVTILHSNMASNRTLLVLLLLTMMILGLANSKPVCSKERKGYKVKGESISSFKSKSIAKCQDACKRNNGCVAWAFKSDKKTTGSCELFSHGSLRKVGGTSRVSGTCTLDPKAPLFEVGGGAEDGIVIGGDDDCVIKVNGKCPQCPGNKFDYVSDTKCTCSDGSVCV
jgi:hypothetical protein